MVNYGSYIFKVQKRGYKMKKILQVQSGMNKGGTEAVIMGWYRNIDTDKYQFDFTNMSKTECSYDNEIKSRGGDVIYLPSRSNVGNIKHCYYLYKCIKENGPYTAVHSHMNFHGGIVALVSKIAGVKNVICHAHNTSDEGKGIKRRLEIFILQRLMKIYSSKLLACGKDAGNFVFGKGSKFEVINNAVDTDKFKPMNKVDIDIVKKKYKLEDTLVLGHIGRFAKQKNHKFIISIIEMMKSQNINFKFILIGDGELKQEFFDEIKTKNLDEYILYLGLQDNISTWLNVMDIFVFPSLYEGLPVVLVEAQATGLPCIISDKITKDVDLGLDLIKFLDIENEKQWCDEILNENNTKIINKELIYTKMKDNGYILKDNTDRVIELYEM